MKEEIKNYNDKYKSVKYIYTHTHTHAHTQEDFVKTSKYL